MCFIHLFILLCSSVWIRNNLRAIGVFDQLPIRKFYSSFVRIFENLEALTEIGFQTNPLSSLSDWSILS